MIYLVCLLKNKILFLSEKKFPKIERSWNINLHDIIIYVVF